MAPPFWIGWPLWSKCLIVLVFLAVLVILYAYSKQLVRKILQIHRDAKRFSCPLEPADAYAISASAMLPSDGTAGILFGINALRAGQEVDGITSTNRLRVRSTSNTPHRSPANGLHESGQPMSTDDVSHRELRDELHLKPGLPLPRPLRTHVEHPAYGLQNTSRLSLQSEFLSAQYTRKGAESERIHDIRPDSDSTHVRASSDSPPTAATFGGTAESTQYRQVNLVFKQTELTQAQRSSLEESYELGEISEHRNVPDNFLRQLDINMQRKMLEKEEERRQRATVSGALVPKQKMRPSKIIQQRKQLEKEENRQLNMMYDGLNSPQEMQPVQMPALQELDTIQTTRFSFLTEAMIISPQNSSSASHRTSTASLDQNSRFSFEIGDDQRFTRKEDIVLTTPITLNWIGSNMMGKNKIIDEEMGYFDPNRDTKARAEFLAINLQAKKYVTGSKKVLDKPVTPVIEEQQKTPLPSPSVLVRTLSEKKINIMLRGLEHNVKPEHLDEYDRRVGYFYIRR